jgi:hypothetical protein
MIIGIIPKRLPISNSTEIWISAPLNRCFSENGTALKLSLTALREVSLSPIISLDVIFLKKKKEYQE